MRNFKNIRPMKGIFFALPWFALVLAAGCSTVARRPATSAAPATKSAAVEGHSATVDVQQDSGEFTLTESVAVEDDVRADY